VVESFYVVVDHGPAADTVKVGDPLKEVHEFPVYLHVYLQR
jgi:hypothetical protein